MLTAVLPDSAGTGPEPPGSALPPPGAEAERSAKVQHQNQEPAEPLRSLLRLLTDVYVKLRGESGASPWRWQQRPGPAQPAVGVGPETFLQQQQRNPSAQVLPVLKELSSGPTTSEVYLTQSFFMETPG